MQNAPIVQLPEQEHHRDWALIIVTLAVILVAIVVVVMLAFPDLNLVKPAVNTYTNPELTLFERFQAGTGAVQTAAGSENPELSAFNRYMELQPGDRSLHENPEVEQFQRWLESR